MIDPTAPAFMSLQASEQLDLIKQLKHERGEYRLAAVIRLKDCGDAGAVEPLCEALTDPNPDVRTAAIKALRQVGDERAIEPLCRSLKDSYRDARICAAEALGRMGDARAVEPLCGLFSDLYQDVRVAAADALVKIGSPSVTSLCSVLRDTQHERMIRGVVIDTKRDADAPIRDLKRSARRLAVTTIGEIGDTSGVPALCAALLDAAVSVRLAAVGALHKMSAPRAVEPLCAAFTDSELKVSAAATRAVMAMKSAKSVEPLCRLIRNGNRTAWEVLLQIGNAYSLPIQVLSDADLTPPQKLDALQALSAVRSGFARKMVKIRDVKAYCEGLCAADVNDPEVKHGAAAVLTELKNREVSTELVRASDRTDDFKSTALLRGVDGSITTSSELMRSSVEESEPDAGREPRRLAILFKKRQ